MVGWPWMKLSKEILHCWVTVVEIPLRASLGSLLFGINSGMLPIAWTLIKPFTPHMEALVGISQVLPNFLPFIKLCLARGNLIRFWIDPWAGHIPLRNRPSSL